LARIPLQKTWRSSPWSELTPNSRDRLSFAMLARILPPIAATALAAMSLTSPAGAQIVPTPRAAELPVTPAARPFLAAAAAAAPVDLAARGYVEREYQVSGQARVYDWDAAGKAQPRAGAPTPYVTRLLVRRPADRARFSGIVVLELLEPTALYDTAPVWSLTQEQVLRAGHAWVGVTVKPVAAAALGRFDAARYGKLRFAYAQKPDCQPPPGLPGAPGGEALAAPTTENGLAYDVVAQAGALLRSGSRENPLQDLEPRRVIATGFGESASVLITWVNALHGGHRLGDGSPVFDAFLQVAGGLAEAPLNQCAAPLPPEDARRRIGPRDVPFISVMTQTEVPRAQALRRQDSDDPRDFYRLYEVAGAAHSSVTGAGRPGSRELALLGREAEDAGDPCEEPAGEFPLALAMNGVLMQMQELLLGGTAPARAPLLSLTADGQLTRDAGGNVQGGLRLPQVVAPVAVYAGRSTPRRPDDAANVFQCSLTGTLRRLDSAELKSLYGNRVEYLRRFNLAVDQAVAERFVVPADAPGLKAAAARTAPQF
jgi:hypothetical protein